MFLALLATLALVSFPHPSTSQGADTTFPLTFPVRVINSNEQVCPSDEVREMVRDEINQATRNLTRNTIIPTFCGGQTQASPAASCRALRTYCPSGYYWVRSSNGSGVQVYCDMDGVCGCSNTGGWTRVANLNMNDPSQQCPGDWILVNYDSEPTRLCGRGNFGIGCLSATYSTYGISYSHVCGRMIGYQEGYVDAFELINGSQVRTIEDPYLEGVSLTHGLPGARQHIWSFAAGLTELVQPTYPNSSCPCAGRLSLAHVPPFVGNDYFCESGNPVTSLPYLTYTNDSLWDGQGCGSPPCCELSYPPGVTAPWFCKQLPQTTTDDIEARVCRDELSSENTPVEIIELYIR